jgi:ribosomal protein S18 acetylase RimI-like enzyme
VTTVAGLPEIRRDLRAPERPAMPDVTLIPMTPQDLEAFVDEEVVDYAHERQRDGTWSRRDALKRARAELLTVIAWERQAMTAEHQRLLTAITPDGRRVGWLWVKRAPAGPWSATAFLCQMTVARASRHRGYGRAMLGALEERLVGDGIDEIHLNVWESNLPAKCLYATAGYERAVQLPTMRRLRKRLRAASTDRPGGIQRTVVLPVAPGRRDDER